MGSSGVGSGDEGAANRGSRCLAMLTCNWRLKGMVVAFSILSLWGGAQAMSATPADIFFDHLIAVMKKNKNALPVPRSKSSNGGYVEITDDLCGDASGYSISEMDGFLDTFARNKEKGIEVGTFYKNGKESPDGATYYLHRFVFPFSNHRLDIIIDREPWNCRSIMWQRSIFDF